MKRIAILSDTHGLLRDEVKQELRAADFIIHAGDIDSGEIYYELKAYKKAFIIRGNNDETWAHYLPKTLTVSIEGVRFFITHHKKDIPKDLQNIDVVVYGHSHLYFVRKINGVLLLNPGSCGKRRFHLDISMCRMYIHQGKYECHKIMIPTS